MSLNLFKNSLKESLVVKKDDYEYVVNPLTDGFPEVNPDLLDEVVTEIEKIVDTLGFFDKIVTLEAMGIPLATLLSQRVNKPFTIIRKRRYNLDSEVVVDQVTGYSKSKLFINGLKKNDKVIIVDDVLSTGGSLKAVLNSLIKLDVDVVGVVVAVDKGLISDIISKEFDVKFDVLVKIRVVDDRVEIL